MGNVRATFSDIKIPTDVASQPFTVDLLSRSEYYPFGMKIDALSWNETGARYGYNGTHEQELAINPEGNYLDFGDFGYDTRTARRQNIDPMFAAYPHLSGYATFNNNPISYADPTGWESEFGDPNQTNYGGTCIEDVEVVADRIVDNTVILPSNNNNAVDSPYSNPPNGLTENIVELGVEWANALGIHQFNNAERALVRQDPLNAITAGANGKRAGSILAANLELFGLTEEDGNYNNRGDAVKHILWATLNSMDLGESKAREFMNAHETYLTNPFNELVMDLHNNELGYQLANKYRKQYKSALKTRGSKDNLAVINSIVEDIFFIIIFNQANEGGEISIGEKYFEATKFRSLERMTTKGRESLVKVLEQINSIR